MKPEISLIPEPVPFVEEREKLSLRKVAELCIRQEGKCGCGCGQKLNPLADGFVDEHMIPLAAGGTNDLSNRRLLRPECAKRKTKADQAPIKKARHQAGGKGSQRYAREKAKAEGTYKPIANSGKLQGGGFQTNRASKYKRRMDGTIEERT